jgi:hypothetical protein
MGERCVKGLIISGIELDLIHIHPDARPFLVRRRSDPTLFRERGHRCHGRRATSRT